MNVYHCRVMRCPQVDGPAVGWEIHGTPPRDWARCGARTALGKRKDSVPPGLRGTRPRKPERLDSLLPEHHLPLSALRPVPGHPAGFVGTLADI